LTGFTELIAAADVPDGTMTEADADGRPMLVAHVGDAFYVADGRCPHLHGPLPKGVLTGTVVTCPWHHSQFDLTDGHVVRWTDWTGAVLAAAEFVEHPHPLRTYEVRVEDGMLLMGPAKEPPA
jgi:3-phenylpropionate/trans-cinnamate dioxygenase ferredoxin subunit